MKNIKRFVSLIISLFIVFSAAACNNGGENSSNSEQEEIPVGEYIVENGKSDYTVVIPDGNDNIINEAASELTYFFKEATNISLSVVTDKDLTYSDADKYISLGETKLASQAGVTAPVETYTTSGYRIVTKGKSVFVVGGDRFGTLWGTYGLLSKWFNYEFFAQDVFTLDTDVTSLELMKYDLSDIPDITNRTGHMAQSYANKQTAHRFRLIEMIGEADQGIGVHNSFSILPPSVYAEEHPDWYSTPNVDYAGGQLSYTANGNEAEYRLMLEASLEYFKSYIVASPDKVLSFPFSMMDNSNFSNYDKTIAQQKYGGAISGTIIAFLNDLAEMTRQWMDSEGIDKEVNYWFFAYMGYEDAPVVVEDGKYKVLIKCDKDVIPFYAPIFASFAKSFSADNSNVQYFETLKKWGAASEEMYLWYYPYNSNLYLYFYNSFDTIKDWYETLSNYNITRILAQNRHDQMAATAFSNLSEYLYSKLAWDHTLNLDDLINRYFKACFGPAADIMIKYFNEQRLLSLYNMNVEGMGGGIWSQMENQTYWPQKTLLNWMDMFDEAYEVIKPLEKIDPDRYDMYYKGILRESLAVRYPYVRLYANNSTPESMEMKRAIKRDCTSLGIFRPREAGDMSSLFISWGV